jgi:hypothetical protein
MKRGHLELGIIFQFPVDLTFNFPLQINDSLLHWILLQTVLQHTTWKHMFQMVQLHGQLAEHLAGSELAR